jgi:hypothetical protein
MLMPWQSFRQADPGREYLALLTYLPLKRFRTLPRFVWYSRQIIRQLRAGC